MTNPNGDGGCSGGDAETIFQFCKSQGGGIPLTSVYGPYVGRSQNLQLTTTAVGYTCSDWGYASTTGVADVLSVKTAMVTWGVVSVCIGCRTIS